MTFDEIRTLETIKRGGALDARKREIAERLSQDWPALVSIDDGFAKLTYAGEDFLQNDHNPFDDAEDEGEE